MEPEIGQQRHEPCAHGFVWAGNCNTCFPGDLDGQRVSHDGPVHWWDRTLRSKMSVRFTLMVATLTGASYLSPSWGSFLGRTALIMQTQLAAEGLAALWPSAFGRRPHACRRARAAWRSLNEVERV